MTNYEIKFEHQMDQSNNIYTIIALYDDFLSEVGNIIKRRMLFVSSCGA